MKKIIFIILAIILLLVTCKATSSPINDKYELCINLDDLIQQIRNQINLDVDESYSYKIYFQIVEMKDKFIDSCKNKAIKSYYKKNLDEFIVYIGNAICERDERWLDQAKMILIITFGDYKNNNMKYIKNKNYDIK